MIFSPRWPSCVGPTLPSARGPSGELSRAYSLLANVLALIGLRTRASGYSAHAQAIAERVGDRHALFRALTVGQLPAFVVGRWQEVERSLTRALVIGAELRVTNDCLVYETLLAYNDMNRGLLGGAEARLQVVRTRATQGRYVVPELWTLVALGEVAYRRGEFGDAIAFAEDSLALASKVGTVDQNSRFQAHGLLALAWLMPSSSSSPVAPLCRAARSRSRLTAPQTPCRSRSSRGTNPVRPH